MTNLQMIQFIAIFIHGSQLLIRNDCNYPTAFGYFIAAHAVLFFILFAQFYIREYLDTGKPKQRAKEKSESNGHVQWDNGITKNSSMVSSAFNNHSPHSDNRRRKGKHI